MDILAPTLLETLTAQLTRSGFLAKARFRKWSGSKLQRLDVGQTSLLSRKTIRARLFAI
jgi:hypothetical protein